MSEKCYLIVGLLKDQENEGYHIARIVNTKKEARETVEMETGGRYKTLRILRVKEIDPW